MARAVALVGFGLLSAAKSLRSLRVLPTSGGRAVENAGLVGSAHLIRITAFERSPFFRQPRILGCWVCLGLCWDRLGFCCCRRTFPKGLRPLDSHNGAPRPLDPSAKLARFATASIDTRFSFVWERNKQGSCRRQLLGNSAKPTFHASLHPALFNSVPLCYLFYFAPANIF